MFPLPVVLVGQDHMVLTPTRQELLNNQADVEHNFGAIKDVIQHAKDLRSVPHLFVVHMTKDAHLDELQRLSSTFVGRPILALVPEGTDVAGVVAAMRAGATQVVILPLNPLDFRSALASIGLHFGRPAEESRLIAVSGVTGGCGATTLAINLAYELAQTAGQQVILVELSMQLGMFVTYLDFHPKYTIRDLIHFDGELDPGVVTQSLTKIGERLHVLAGPERPIAMTPDALARIRLILNYLRHLASVVVIDIPCTFDDAYFELMAAADHAVLVCEQRIPAIRNVQLVLGSLAGKDTGARQHIVVNRYDAEAEGFTTKDLEKLLGRAPVLTMASDPASVNAALNQGQPLRVAYPHSRVLADLETLTRTVLDQVDSPKAKLAGSTMFGRLCNAIGLK